jgi:hypothetical protein
MPPNYKVQPTIAPSQYVFITLAVVGVLVSGFLLFDSFSGSGRVLSDDAFSQLANSNKNEPYQQGGGASEQASRMVGMSILSDPPMATVYVDFDSMGVTPVSPDALEAGTYFLSVSKPGYMTYDTLVTLQSGEHPLLWFTLDPWDTDALGQVAQVRRDREIETPMRLLPPESAMPAEMRRERFPKRLVLTPLLHSLFSFALGGRYTSTGTCTDRTRTSRIQCGFRRVSISSEQYILHLGR